MSKVISRKQLVRALSAIKGATIVGLKTKSDDPARFVRDQGRITKFSSFSVVLNAQYDRAKAKRLGVNVEDITVDSKTWRERVGETPILRHVTKGTEYLEALFLSGSTTYTLDGKPCEREDVKDIIKGGGGLANVVPYRTPNLPALRVLRPFAVFDTISSHPQDILSDFLGFFNRHPDRIFYLVCRQ